MRKLNIERTKKGFPALWESGGGYSNTGKATIIAGPNGEKKAPLYIRQRGPLACANHALFIVHEGDTVIQSSHHRGDFHHEICRIVAIRGDEAELEWIAEFYRGQWDTGPLGQKLEADLARMAAGEPPTMELSIAVQMAESKATAYHCRNVYYCLETVPAKRGAGHKPERTK
jgi:hypothetical protein